MSKAQSIRDLSQGNRNIWNLDPHLILMKPGWNPRDEDDRLKAHIETITASIRAIGFDQSKPLTVYLSGDGHYAISDGHCRLRAVLAAIEQGAEIATVPVVLEARGINEADRVAGILTRNSGLNLSPIEQGRVYKRLAGFGWDEKRIAATSGKPLASVRQIFDLMEAEPDTQAAVIAGEVSVTAVAGAVREHGPEKAKRVVAKAVAAAKANGKSKATTGNVRAAATSENGVPARTPSEVLRFFRTTVEEQDGPEGVQRLAEIILAFAAGRIGPEVMMKRLGAMVGGGELAEVA